MSGNSPAGSNPPLTGVRVLNTRPREDSAALRQRLEALGAVVHDLPAIGIQPLTDSADVRAALSRLDGYEWIAFTSRNAVRALFACMAALGLTGALRARVAAVGPSTATELRSRGIEVECVAQEATSRGLGQVMQARGVAGARVLLPLGNLTRTELREMLLEAGARVEEIVVYETGRPADVKAESMEVFRTGGIDVIAFASPSAVRNLADALGDAADQVLRRSRAVCIGPTTAEALRELGTDPAAVAREPTLDGLVAAVVEAMRV